MILTQDELNRTADITPLCLLDFYVDNRVQRQGNGKRLFDHVVKIEFCQPHEFAYDRPSPKCLEFLRRQYKLSQCILINKDVTQANHYVLFNEYGLSHLSLDAAGRPKPVDHTKVKCQPQIRHLKKVALEPRRTEGLAKLYNLKVLKDEPVSAHFLDEVVPLVSTADDDISAALASAASALRSIDGLDDSPAYEQYLEPEQIVADVPSRIEQFELDSQDDFCAERRDSQTKVEYTHPLRDSMGNLKEFKTPHMNSRRDLSQSRKSILHDLSQSRRNSRRDSVKRDIYQSKDDIGGPLNKLGSKFASQFVELKSLESTYAINESMASLSSWDSKPNLTNHFSAADRRTRMELMMSHTPLGGAEPKFASLKDKYGGKLVKAQRL